MTIQYATLEEAWSGSSAPKRYSVKDEFDVAKTSVGAPTYAGIEDDVAIALESAYPPPDRKSRRAKTLSMHSPSAQCSAIVDQEDEGYRDQYEDTRRAVASPGEMDDDGDEESHMGRNGPPEYMSSRTENGQERERGALYDVLVFVLFGLLLVMAMHEAANLGVAIGKTL